MSLLVLLLLLRVPGDGPHDGSTSATEQPYGMLGKPKVAEKPKRREGQALTERKSQPTKTRKRIQPPRQRLRRATAYGWCVQAGRAGKHGSEQLVPS